MDDSERVPTSGSLSARAISGLGWVYASTAFHAVAQVTYTVVMARLLSPAAFGVFAVAVLVGGFATRFSYLGIGSALVQKSNLSSADIRAGFTLSAFSGAVLFALLWLVAPLVSVIFHNPAVVPVVRAMGGVLFLSTLWITPDALLRRDLRFQQTSLAGMTAFTVGYLLIGIGSALLGAGVWSLVAAHYSSNVTYLLITYGLTRHPLRPTVDLHSLGAIAGYGGRLTVINILDFAGTNVDTFAIGRFSGTAALGVYNRVFNLVVVPLYMLSAGLVQVLFSGFSLIQKDLERLKRVFVTSVATTAAVLLPICAGMAVAFRELVIATVGLRYAAAIEAVPYLTIAGAFGMMSRLSGALCESLARFGARTILQAAYLVVLIIAMLEVAGGPLWRYAAVLAVCEMIRWVGFQLIAARLIHLQMRDVARMYLRPVIAAGVVAASSLLIRGVLTAAGVTSPSILLLAQVFTDAAVFILLIRFGPLTFLVQEAKGRLAGSQSRLNAAMSSRVFRAFFGEIG